MFKDGLQNVSCIILRKTISYDWIVLKFYRCLLGEKFVIFFKCKITHFDIKLIVVSFNVTHGRPTTRLSSDPCYLFLGVKLNHTNLIIFNGLSQFGINFL